MNKELFDLILKVATYDGDACYNNIEEMESDYKINKFVSLTPLEIKKLINTAYEFGKNKIDIKEN